MSNPSYLLEPAAISWEGGTPVSPLFEDIYWHRDQALQEKQFVFVDAVARQLEQVDSITSNLQFTVAELGFGFGINCLLTAEFWQQHAGDAQLNLVSFEKHPVRREDLAGLLNGLPLSFADALLDQYPPPIRGQHVIWLAPNIRLLLVLDDAERGLSELDADVDHWYLDGFSPSRNPALWASSIVRQVFARSRPGAVVSTYSAAGHVRRALEQHGFAVQREPGFGRKKEMLSAHAAGKWQPQTRSGESVVILGAGMAGHYCAEALAKRGVAYRLIDNGKPGASRVPQLSVFPQLAVESEAKYRFSLVASQYMKTSQGFHADGMHWIPRNTEEGDRLRRLAGQFPDEMIAVRADGSLDYQLAGWLSTAALFEALSPTIETHDIDHLRLEEQWYCESAGDVVARTGRLIVATGFDRQLMDPRLNIRAVRGQATSVPATNLDRILNSHVTIFPGLDGSSLISGTYARSDDLTPSRQDTEDLVEAASALHDIVAGQTTDWVGIRAVSRDRLPIVGPAPDWDALASVNRISAITEYQPGLYLCQAFASRGATHARLCAEHVVSKLLGEPAALPWEHQYMLSPARFTLRDRP